MSEDKNIRVKSKKYPAVTLEETIKFLNTFKDFPISKPISYDTAAHCMGLKEFKYKVAAIQN